MKIFKKIISIALILLLSITLRVYAGSVEAKLTATSNEVKIGETVTATLSAQHGNGIEGFDAVLSYDKTKLKLLNEDQLAEKNYTSMSGTDDATGEFRLSLIYTGSGKGSEEANIAQLKFEVLNQAKVNDELSVKLTKINLIDSNEHENELEDVEIKLKVVEEQKDPGGDNTNPGGNNNTTPGGNNTTPGGNNNTNTNGNNTNSGDYPYAGIENYMFIIIVAISIIAIVGYTKVKKYRDIK